MIGKIIFLAIILIFCADGLMMILTCKRNTINWYGLFFLAFVPFMPIIALICGVE